MEDKGLTMRETLHKIMGAAGNTMDVVSNSTTMANNLVDAGVSWSEGVARGAKRRNIDVRLAEDAASLNRRFEAAKLWRKAKVGMDQLDVEIVNEEFVMKSERPKKK